MASSSPRPGRPKGSDPDRRRADLLEAAETLFSEKGFDGASMGEIAEAAGVTKAMVRYYFGDKLSLYSAVLDAIVTEVLDDLVERLGETPEAGGFERYVGAFARAIMARPSFGQMLLRDYLDGRTLSRPETLMTLRRFMDMTTTVYGHGREAGEHRSMDPHQLHLMIVGAAMYFSVTGRFRAQISETQRLSLDEDAYIDALADTLTRGLAADRLGD